MLLDESGGFVLSVLLLCVVCRLESDQSEDLLSEEFLLVSGSPGLKNLLEKLSLGRKFEVQ